MIVLEVLQRGDSVEEERGLRRRRSGILGKNK